VKFLCDRCKTRYSIGDERVRGKILKIRCKNCNNVITVREGMDAAPGEGRKNQPTQAIEAVGQQAAAVTNGALGAAFASAMTKPPPALEEEWYVSVEGDQAGPFSLAEAQRWVAAKPFDAELHCWSEGFDDWLPVDKVSHFRGLRKKPAAAPAPPPLPRGRPMPSEETPKPLFAATMASLEKATQPPLGSGNFNIPAPAAPTPAPSSTRGTPLGGQPAISARGTNGKSTPLPSSLRAGEPAVTPGRVATAAAVKPAFDPVESATQIEAPPFEDENRTVPAKPAAKADPFGYKPPLDVTQQIQTEDIDDDLNIGEVSRVVKLADLAATSSRSTRASTATPKPMGDPMRRSQPMASLNRTGSIPSMPTLNRTGSLPSMPMIGPDGQQIDPSTGAPIPLAPQVAVSHRRGMIALIVGAILLLGAAGAIVFVVTSSDDEGSSGLGGLSEIDTTRPDDIRRPGKTAEPAVDTKEPQNPFVPKPRPKPTNPNPPQIPTNPNAKDLRPDEIEEMATKSSASTQTCWRRSQRGAEAILLADLKKLGVTLTVDKSGVVTNVTLSDHATTSLGKCLITNIKGWKFRESTAGITARITLVF
jgi:predicted Zn finger-like uncharacterized protein